MSFKTVVPITGANTDIGYESVEALLRSHTSHHILLGSRSIAKGEHAVKQSHAGNPSSLSTVEVLCVDISSDYSINSAFEVVKNSHGRVNVLVNNGGIALNGNPGKITTTEISTRTAFNDVFNANVTGTHIMTGVFVPLLQNSANPRLLFLTSGLAQIQALAESLTELDKSGSTAGALVSSSVPSGPAGNRATKDAIQNDHADVEVGATCKWSEDVRRFAWHPGDWTGM